MLDLLLLGERNGVVNDAGARGGHGQRHLAFEDRDHGFHFEYGIEAGGPGRAFLLILAGLFEEFGNFGDLLFVGTLGRGEARGAGAAGDHSEDHIRHCAAASTSAAKGGEDQMHGCGTVDRHVFPGPAVGVYEGCLAGNELALASAETSASAAGAAARRGEGHHAGDAVHADHAEVFTLRIDGAEGAQLRHELAEFASIDSLTHRGDFRETELCTGIDHARIDSQTLAFDDARALRGKNFRADLADLAILQDDRDSLHFRVRSPGIRPHYE